MRKHLLVLKVITFLNIGFCYAQKGGLVVSEDTTYPVGQFSTFLNYNPIASSKYQRLLVPKKPIQDETLITINSLPEDVAISTTYYDLHGRPIEKVVKAASPLKKDYVAPIVYDLTGNITRGYLPYVATTGNGLYKDHPLVADSIFYKSLFPGDPYFFSKAKYDASPLEKLLKATPEGAAWTGANRGKSFAQRANGVSDSVRIWTIGISTEDEIASSTTTYAAGNLIVEEVTDEKGIKALVYKDEQGRTVLTKMQLSNGPGTGHEGWLCTYYVYDEMGKLRLVIPPKAVELLNGSWNLSANSGAINNGFCYRYWYDELGRSIMKYIPGQGKSYVAYDAMDRVVMTQDANLRQTGQWTFLKYDGQSRPYKSGIIATSLIKDSIFAQASRSIDYPALSGTYTVTSETYYDDYSWVSTSGTSLAGSLVSTNINSTNFYSSYNASPEYAQAISQGNRTRGSMTGRKRLILNSNDYLYTLNIFDENGRNIQSKQTNISTGIDVSTFQYNFTGTLLRFHFAHEKVGSNAQSHTVLTKYSYDHSGRLLNLVKNLDGLGDKTISQHSYSELGQLKQKIIGNGLETQQFSYSIRGWLTGMNKNYVDSGATGHWFGESLFYDYGNPAEELNGNMAVGRWKAGGDGVARAYTNGYDNANRLSSATFAQQNEGSTAWTKDKADFSVSNLSYDANGNILSMTRRGLLIGSSAIIDSLTYQYFNNSNLLQKVTDLASPPGGGLADFTDSTNTGDDYTYDVNGNINRDNNRHLHTTANGVGAVFNLLDKADSIVIAGTSTTYYTYDVTGTMLAKKVNNYQKNITTNYTYIGGFVYKSYSTSVGGPKGDDTLQYALIEGGRIRNAKKVNSQTGSIYYAYEYDYFITDHQGNVRTVLTEGKDTTLYQATMETSRNTLEDALFANIYTPVNTVSNKPTGFDSDSNNQKVCLLNATPIFIGNELPPPIPKTGPSIVLKVMAGDKVQTNTFSYYTGPAEPPGEVNDIASELINALTGGILGKSGGKYSSGNTSSLNSILIPNLSSFLYGEERSYDFTRPKAYLNWIMFDEQFNFVPENSGSIQVDESTEKYPLVAPLQNIIKNGYLFIFVNNESQQNVFFDDLTVTHTTGPLLQEQSYYPYGLEMVGISSKAMLKAATSYKYNGGCELEEEDGISYYNTFYRKYDAQIGRFTGVDMLSEKTMELNPYQFGMNNPVMFNDPMGDRALRMQEESLDDNSKDYGNRLNLQRQGKDWTGNDPFGWGEDWLNTFGGFSPETPGYGLSYEESLGMSKYVYGGDNAKASNLIGGWKVSKDDDGLINDDKESGFKGMLFEKTVNGRKIYTYAFAGTENHQDGLQDAQQMLGLARQYKLAVDNAKELNKKFGNTNVSFVGHSLGGGLATAAALSINSRAVTFNPAWLSGATIKAHTLDINSGRIINYVIRNEIVNVTQSMMSMTKTPVFIHIGKDIFRTNPLVGILNMALPGTWQGSVVGHLISSF